MARVSITVTSAETVEVPDYFFWDETLRGRLVDLLMNTDDKVDYAVRHCLGTLCNNNTHLNAAQSQEFEWARAKLEDAYDRADKLIDFFEREK